MTNTTTKTAVLTGATSGLGEAAALALAAKGWRVLVVGRDAERGNDVVSRAKKLGGDGAFIAGDLFTVAGVRALAADVRAETDHVELLVNNAGGTFGKTITTTDGLERTFALNVMAPYVLTDALLPELSAAKGRVVNLVTGIPKGAKATIAELTGERASAGLGGYTRAKLALAALTRQQQKRYADRQITCVSLHPGIIPGTRFGQDMPAFLRAFGAFLARLFGFGSTLDQAAARYLAVGTGDVEGGAFYDQGKRADAPTQATDDGFGAALFTELGRIAKAPAALAP